MRKLKSLFEHIAEWLHSYPVLIGALGIPLLVAGTLWALNAWSKLPVEKLFFLITPLLVFFGGLLAAFVAVRNTKVASGLMRDKATLDLILKEETDPFILEKRLSFVKLRTKGKLIERSSAWGAGKYRPLNDSENHGYARGSLRDRVRRWILNNLEEENKKADEAIGFVLNSYEMIAIGIENHLLSEKIYDEWLGSTLIKDWKELAPFIMQVRLQYKEPKLYIFFEELAKRLIKKRGL